MSQSPRKAQLIKRLPNQNVCIDSETQLFYFLNSKVQTSGKLLVTNFRICFFAQENIIFEFPLGFITRCQRSLDQNNTSYLQLILKMGVTIRLKYTEEKFQNSNMANAIINKLTQIGTIFVGQTPSEVSQMYGSWVNPYLDCGQGEIFDNKKWAFFLNYPDSFIVPPPYIGKRDQQTRLVVLSFIYKIGQKQTLIWRSGPGKPDPSEQQWMPKVSMQSHKHMIIQIKVKGSSTKNITPKYFQLESLTNLRQNLGKMIIATDSNEQPTKWLQNVHGSKWFHQIAIILSQAIFVAERLQGGINITIMADQQCRGAQISAIAQLILNPEYRTFAGFPQLIEKQFLQFGVSKPFLKKEKQQDKGIILIQFLDCVTQLTHIYPLSFEFNDYYLSFLATNVYSNRFANFLLASRAILQKQREKSAKMPSIWHCNQMQGIQFKNCFYIDYKNCDMFELKDSISMKKIKLWQVFFVRLFKQKNHIDFDALCRYQWINFQHMKLKRETEYLRKKIMEQHGQIIEKKKKLKELKKNEL